MTPARIPTVEREQARVVPSAMTLAEVRRYDLAMAVAREAHAERLHARLLRLVRSLTPPLRRCTDQSPRGVEVFAHDVNMGAAEHGVESRR